MRAHYEICSRACVCLCVCCRLQDCWCAFVCVKQTVGQTAWGLPRATLKMSASVCMAQTCMFGVCVCTCMCITLSSVFKFKKDFGIPTFFFFVLTNSVSTQQSQYMCVCICLVYVYIYVCVLWGLRQDECVFPPLPPVLLLGWRQEHVSTLTLAGLNIL